MIPAFYKVPIAILAGGITKACLTSICEYNIGSYMDEHEKTIDELRNDWHFRGFDGEQCKSVFEHYKDCKVMSMISLEQLNEWWINVENESDNSKLLLLAFLAVKSIVGKKDYAITNYDLLLARMAGDSVPRYYGKQLILPDHLKQFKARKNKKPRRKLERLREELRRFHVATWGCPGLRGFAISTKLTDLELAIKIATDRPKPQAQLAKERKERVKAEVKKLQGLSD